MVLRVLGVSVRVRATVRSAPGGPASLERGGPWDPVGAESGVLPEHREEGPSVALGMGVGPEQGARRGRPQTLGGRGEGMPGPFPLPRDLVGSQGQSIPLRCPCCGPMGPTPWARGSHRWAWDSGGAAGRLPGLGRTAGHRRAPSATGGHPQPQAGTLSHRLAPQKSSAPVPQPQPSFFFQSSLLCPNKPPHAHTQPLTLGAHTGYRPDFT